MGLITITTTTTDIRDALGNPAAGSFSIRPKSQWTYDDGAGGKDVVVTTPKPVTVATGKVTDFTLAPTLNGGVTMTDASYVIIWNINNTPQRVEEWIIDANAGSPMELANIHVIPVSDALPGLPVIGPQGPAGPTGTQGPQGPAGQTVLNGTSDPGAGTGSDGDFYINTTTNTIFGPKAAGAWPAGVRIDAEAAAAAADASRIAAEAAWTAALAANPDLNPQIRMNPSTVAADIAIPTGFNAYSSGPLEIGEGITVTVEDFANWNII